MAHAGNFKKGHKGGPGRPKVLLPEVQNLVDANKNALKVAIIEEVSPKVREWIKNIITMGIHEGDAAKFKMLMELALGKLVDDPPDFPLSDEEKILVLEYRRRKKEHDERSVAVIDE